MKDSDTFLTLVARDLLSKYGNDLKHVTVVFPGKRASLFLNQALATEADGPVWAPRYRTISELFADASPYRLANPVESVCRLHRVYERHVPEPYPLDQFYTWGEVLLSDFDDIDKHLVDADRLFTNITDLRELDSNAYITPEQEEALRSFFANFSLEGNTRLKQRFLELWQHMSAIYHEFNDGMKQAGLCYEGALQRAVVEHDLQAVAEKFGTDTICFVGFNVLNQVESRLFTALKRAGRALFYWDYDRYYMQPSAVQHEAGHFMRANLERFAGELSPEHFDHLCPPTIPPTRYTIVSSSSENAQARFVDQWLSSHLTHPENRTAVVLCNESLLGPVLHAVPTDIPLNVTMGYPLTDTPVYSYLMSLLNLQTDGWDDERKRFRRSYVRTVQNHPFSATVPTEKWLCLAGEGSAFLAYLREVLTYVANTTLAPSLKESNGVGQTTPSPFSPLVAEAVFRCYESLGVLQRMTEGPAPLLTVSRVTLRRLIRSVLRPLSVPFHGEPATGLQVMGLLETRALDFRNLLMLSVGEGFLPKTAADTTFIPYALKEAFGLTTVRHQMAVYAYYFYRLIQRAEHITFVYNDSNAGSRQNEISRFLRQLMSDASLPIRHFRLTADSTVHIASPQPQAKTPEMMALLRERHSGASLSPTAINTYTTCPLQFYYKYVRGMRVNPTAADGLDAAVFGNVFHKAAQLTYEDLRRRGACVRGQDIDFLLEAPEARLGTYVDQAFREDYFQPRQERPSYEGLLIIARRALITYLTRLLVYDRQLTPFRIIGLETNCEAAIRVNGNPEWEVRTGGIIDRLDEVFDEATGRHVLRVVDYKTGGRPASVSAIDRLFADTGQTEHYYFQTILYATIIARERHVAVQPALFFVHKCGVPDYTPALTLERQVMTDVTPLAADFQERLVRLVSEIFNPSIPFAPTSNVKHCSVCPYRELCGR